MKKLLIICVCTLMLVILGGCGDEEHITRKEATKIAEGLTGGEVTYVETETVSDTHVEYKFTDSRDNTFSIISYLSKPSIDGAILKYSPYDCSVSNNYQKTVLANNIEAIKEILDKYGFTDNIKIIFDDTITLKFYLGTPEENRNLLKEIAKAGAEMDALLSINYDKEYYSSIKGKYDIINPVDVGFNAEFYKKLENQNREEMVIDIAHPDFSISDDTRWTADSLYKAMLEDMDSTDIAE